MIEQIISSFFFTDESLIVVAGRHQQQQLEEQPVVRNDDGVLSMPGNRAVGTRAPWRQRRLSHLSTVRPPGRPSLETTSFLGCGSRSPRRLLPSRSTDRCTGSIVSIVNP